MAAPRRRTSGALRAVVAEPPKQGSCILLVEDNATARRALVRIFERVGWSPIEAIDVESARLALVQRPRVVVTDLQLRTDRHGQDPGGVRVLASVRAMLPDVAVILHSGVVDFDEHRGAMFDAVVEKPNHARDLLRIADLYRGGRAAFAARARGDA